MPVVKGPLVNVDFLPEEAIDITDESLVDSSDQDECAVSSSRQDSDQGQKRAAPASQAAERSMVSISSPHAPSQNNQSSGGDGVRSPGQNQDFAAGEGRGVGRA